MLRRLESNGNRSNLDAKRRQMKSIVNMEVDNQSHALPTLPTEVIGLVAEQLSALGSYGTLADLNITCKELRRETLPVMWKRVLVTRFEEAGWKYTPDEYEELFRTRFDASKYYKYIQYIIDEDGLIIYHGKVNPHDSTSTRPYNPFREATFVGYRNMMCRTRHLSRNGNKDALLVRLGTKYQVFTNDLMDTLQAEFQFEQPTLFDSINGYSTEKLQVHVADFVKPTRAPSMTLADMKAMLDHSPPGWFPSGRIDEVHVLPQISDEPSDFDADYLRRLTLEMLSLLAVSVGKHVLLGADSGLNCKTPFLCMSGLRLEEVDTVVGLWFSVVEHSPSFAGIRVVLALREGSTINLNDVVLRFQQWKNPYWRYCQKEEETPSLKFQLVDSNRRLIAHLGQPTYQHQDGAAGLCVYDSNAVRMRQKCVIFENWKEDTQDPDIGD